MSREPYLIIGNSAAAVAAVEGIRSVDAGRRITIVSREPHHTYSRPLVSYLLAGRVDEPAMLYRPHDFYERNNIRPLLGVEATHVDCVSRAVQLADGRSVEFEKLLIATGGKPIVPRDVPGIHADGVFTLTTWDDARNLKAYIEQNEVEEALVVGGGLIGLKCAEALFHLGIGTTVVELADHILAATLDETASRLARGHLEQRGVSVRCGTTISRISAGNGRVSGAELRDGARVSCGAVILAIGVRPDASIVRDTEVRVEQGIVVDETMQTGVEGIYAAGDVAQIDDLLGGGKRVIPIFPNAYRQGLIAGCNMAGGRRTYRGGIAMNSVDVLGLPTVSVGVTTPQGREYEELAALEDDPPRYRKVVLREGRVVGAVFVGDIDRAGIITGLIKEGIDVSSFKEALLTEGFGVLSLPAEYRKHVVSGLGIEV